MNYLDCTAGIGPWTVPPPAGPLDVASLRRELAEHGIGSALVHHGLARDYDPAAGNEALLRELAGAGESPDGVTLTPCATLLPHQGREVPPPREHVPSLLARGVRGVRLYPHTHTFSLAEWCLGELLDTLERHRVPLSVEFAETGWDQIHALCAAHPALPVLVTRAGYRQERMLFPLWERHPNLYIETSHFQAHRGLEHAVACFGPERLLFGTGLPFFSPGAAVMLVHRAEVSEDARAAVAGGNLRRLLDAVRVAP